MLHLERAAHLIIEHLHKRLLDNLSTGVIVFDHELRLGYINLAAESILAISGKQIHNAWIGDIFLDSSQDIADIQNARSRPVVGQAIAEQ